MNRGVDNGWEPIRQMRQQGVQSGGSERLRGRSQAQVRALAPTGTAPDDVGHRGAATLVAADHPLLTGREYLDTEEEPQPLQQRTLRVYPFGVNRDRLAQSARLLRVPVVITNDQGQADAVITLKNYYRRQPERLQHAEEQRKLIIILKNNTVAQMQHALARIFDIPMMDALPDDEEESGNGKASDDPTMQVLLETEDAIHQVLNKGLTTAELPPANAYIRRLQHQMATRYNLISRSRGKEPNRRVKIFRSGE